MRYRTREWIPECVGTDFLWLPRRNGRSWNSARYVIGVRRCSWLGEDMPSLGRYVTTPTRRINELPPLISVKYRRLQVRLVQDYGAESRDIEQAPAGHATAYTRKGPQQPAPPPGSPLRLCHRGGGEACGVRTAYCVSPGACKGLRSRVRDIPGSEHALHFRYHVLLNKRRSQSARVNYIRPRPPR